MKNFLSKGIVTFVICSLVLGQGSRMGTASSTQLQISQGAQYLSGGGAASNATGMEAAYWNPAGFQSDSRPGLDSRYHQQQCGSRWDF